MALWLKRVGSGRTNEGFSMESGVVATELCNVGDLSTATSRENVKDLLRAAYLGDGEAIITTPAGQPWTFASRTQAEDPVPLPMKSQPAIAFGRITGERHSFRGHPIA